MNNEKQTAVLTLAEKVGFEAHRLNSGSLIARHSNSSWVEVTTEVPAFAAAIRDAALEEAAAICEAHDCGQGVFEIIRALKGKK